MPDVLCSYFIITSQQGPNALQRRLVDDINKSGKIGVTMGELHGKVLIRFVVGNSKSAEKHMIYAWNVIRDITSKYVMPKDECANSVIEKGSL